MCDAAGWDRVSAADEVGVESYIRQLTALDADSFSFRYVGSTEGGSIFACGAEEHQAAAFRCSNGWLITSMHLGRQSAFSMMERWKWKLNAEYISELRNER